jgi:hypothetical protein
MWCHMATMALRGLKYWTMISISCNVCRYWYCTFSALSTWKQLAHPGCYFAIGCWWFYVTVWYSDRECYKCENRWVFSSL